MSDLRYILPLLAVMVALLVYLICARRHEARERAAMERRLTRRQAELLERLRVAMHESMRHARARPPRARPPPSSSPTPRWPWRRARNTCAGAWRSG